MWKTPKTDWTIDDRFNIEDYNRIKNNLNYLHDKSEEIFGEYDIADMGEDVLSHAGFWDVTTFNEFESNLETINAHMINAEIGLKQTFYPNGVFIGFAELNRIEGATLTLKAVIDGWYEGMKVLSFRLGGSQIGSDRIQRKDSVVSIAVTGTESIHAYVDEPLDLTGIVVTATYKSGETQNVTSECVFNPANGTIMTQTGQQTISVSYTEDGKTVTNSFTVNVSIHIPDWSTGTDAQLASALEMHYNGDIDLSDYWHVGDKRSVHVNAIEASDIYPARNAQDLTLVIVNIGGKTIWDSSSPLHQRECAFIVALDERIYPFALVSSGNVTINNIQEWLGNSFFNALPASTQALFKQPQNKTYTYPSGISFSYTKFSLPSEKEVRGTNVQGVTETDNSQFEYYTEPSNYLVRTSAFSPVTWVRSYRKNYETSTSGVAVYIDTSSEYASYFESGTANNSIKPFGII